MKPITPKEIQETTAPDVVIRAFNTLIKVNFLKTHNFSCVFHDTLILLIEQLYDAQIPKAMIANSGWLEQAIKIYEKVGWQITKETHLGFVYYKFTPRENY